MLQRFADAGVEIPYPAAGRAPDRGDGSRRPLPRNGLKARVKPLDFGQLPRIFLLRLKPAPVYNRAFSSSGPPSRSAAPRKETQLSWICWNFSTVGCCSCQLVAADPRRPAADAHHDCGGHDLPASQPGASRARPASGDREFLSRLAVAGHRHADTRVGLDSPQAPRQV